jgi:hypothetical protein
MGETGFLEAQLHSGEQLDKRPPWKVEGRTMEEQLSRGRDCYAVTGCRVVSTEHHG